MPDLVRVVVATYGDDPKWGALSLRAMTSVENLGRVELMASHHTTLANARNEGAKSSDADWLIFLDADDELSPGYIEAMLAGSGDIRKPSTLGVVDGVEDDYPVMIPKRNLLVANHIVIGAMVRRDMFLSVGGFRELPALEDWDLFLRMCLEQDAVVTEVPDAVYRVHVSQDSRNNNVAAHRAAYIDIKNYADPIARSKGISEL